MAGRGPAPKDPAQRRRANEASRGEWQSTPAEARWQGPVPSPPKGLMPASRAAWRIWFKAWFASHWTPDDLPALRQLVRLYDQVERGHFERAAELRLTMDTWGISPKGQQDRRWRPPAPPRADEAEPLAPAGLSRYSHLRVVDPS